ncbi:MAG: reprolysin-like metallopeptidase [Pseudomonadota bacterium]
MASTSPDARQTHSRIMNPLIARAAVADGRNVIIDLLVVYTRGLASGNFSTKLNNLITLTNQAYVDSKADLRLRLAAAKRVNYADGGDNSRALDDLRNGFGSLRVVRNLRHKKGADVVVLLRPFKPAAQGGACGMAWVNGAGGSELRADLVNLGTRSGYYCTNYTLAHEVGHVLGAAHDREHADVTGKFPYSYGCGIEGRFGDIMSYYDPEIGMH